MWSSQYTIRRSTAEFQELTPTYADEAWDADYEDSGSEDDRSSSDSAPTTDPGRDMFRFTVRREGSTGSGVPGESDGWINTSHFLWTMCATLADGGTDREWTASFEQWRPQWKAIETQLKTYGSTRFSSAIPPAPVDLALVQFLGCKLNPETREFEIEQEDAQGVSDGQDIWTLWRYIIETPADQIRDFHVLLRDTAKVVGS
ncbi:uncharacterized protein N7515_005100 [Penicillium bovifimosum]|uniref:Uncharacterized protein n=1 Tax=Penicillium bovifimosum TaxID=126998 RepID=A0A9W9H1F0_9EURO|nr:uncharacterized protein N7515_005100 [Penicillium bovifimosum]KAJ5135822.1 hypothetical protein N7515_005100 [Penicillium bovifimosum]